MCGFVIGYQAPFTPETLQNTALNLSHRGNEPFRFWYSQSKFEARSVSRVATQNTYSVVFAAHTRLAFQDLSAAAAQPFFSMNETISRETHSNGFPNETWGIVFNGEIYNHNELRKDLVEKFGFIFQTHSDTEVLLKGFFAWGEKLLEKIEGEYAFCVFEENGNEIFCARDNFGAKPFSFEVFPLKNSTELEDTFRVAQNSYSFEIMGFCGASELKGLPGDKKLSRTGFLRQIVGLYEPICTPFQNVFHLPAGSVLHMQKKGGILQCKLKLRSVPIRQLPLQKNEFTRKEWESQFKNTFAEAVQSRLVSDVELGVYLSGGIDSQAVASQIQKEKQHIGNSDNASKVKSFTVGFELSGTESNKGFDETQKAKLFADAFGFENKVFKVNEEYLAYSYIHGVQNSENIQPYTNGAAKWWLSLFTSQFVPGVLTGDGSDELLCGYPSFKYCAWWQFLNRNHKSQFRGNIYSRKFASDSKNPWLAGNSSAGIGTDFKRSLKLWGIPHPLFEQIFSQTSILLGNEAEEWLASQGKSIRSWMYFGFNQNTVQTLENDSFFQSQNTMLLWQNYFSKTHLPVQVLNWVGDRMEMANTLEGRTPFLDKRLAKLLYAMPHNNFVRGFQDKSILRTSLKETLGHFANAPKMQFGAPLFEGERKAKQFKNSDNDIKIGFKQILQDSCYTRTGWAELLTTEFQLDGVERRMEQCLEKKVLTDNFQTTTNILQTVHVASLKQALASFEVVYKSLVEKKQFHRDRNREKQALQAQV